MSVSAWPFQQGASHRCAGFHTLLRISKLYFLEHVFSLRPHSCRTQNRTRKIRTEHRTSVAAAVRTCRFMALMHFELRFMSRRIMDHDTSWSFTSSSCTLATLVLGFPSISTTTGKIVFFTPGRAQRQHGTTSSGTLHLLQHQRLGQKMGQKVSHHGNEKEHKRTNKRTVASTDIRELLFCAGYGHVEVHRDVPRPVPICHELRKAIVETQ